MYHRDFAILALSIFAVYFALQNEGPFFFKPAWRYPLTTHQGVLTNGDTLPLPVVIDLNGDGNLEVVMVTKHRFLKVLRGKVGRNEEDRFVLANLMGEVSLDTNRPHTPPDIRPVALSAGYIDKPSKDLVSRPRKGVILVMMSDWHVLCFDYNLKLMWSHNIHSEIHSHAVVHEVSILITNHTVYKNDRGLVVVGGSMNLRSKFEDESVIEQDEDEEDPFEAQLRAERKEFEKIKRLGEKEEEDKMEDEQILGADVSRHFSFYAFDGGSGDRRWRHVGSDFKRDIEEMKDWMIPQKFYKMEAEHLNSMSYSEVACRDYRRSILHNLPHQWNQRIDTSMKLSYFEKHKVSKGQRKKDLALQKNTPTKSPPCTRGKCQKNALSDVIGKLSEKAVSGGRVSASQSKPKNFNPTTSQPPNAIVAHFKEGMQAIHLYTGRSLCKLHLPDGGLHVDLNGDGVLDHLQVSTGPTNEWTTARGHHRIPHCFAYATSGVPPKEPFFNGSICGHSWNTFFQNGERRDAYQNMDIAPPTMLPIPTPQGHHRFHYGQRGYAIFLNNEGELTAFDSRGRKKWAISTDCRWSKYRHSFKKMQPTLKAFPLRPDALPTAVLLAGRDEASVVSERGKILASFTLPAPPSVPLQIIDFNGDGLNDVLLISEEDIYGFVQMPDLGGQPFGMLVLCLIVAMGIIYAAQHTTTETTRRIKRSTDRTD